ncbi:MAG TPA: aldo/keto reductase [Dehalococcoidia bacterium]|nr:aldo/keto reductase [Dehalococcoidia bacterium]
MSGRVVSSVSMIYRRLGRTEMMISEAGFGGWAIGGEGWGDVRDEDSLAAVQGAYELGVNFFDTADVYGHGHSEELLGQALGEFRDRVLIATKVGVDFTKGEPARHSYDPAYILEAVERSLERLRTTYIDLYQLHNPPQKLTKNDALWETLADLRARKKIRFYGISAKTANDALAYLRFERESGEKGRFGDTLQVAYNMIDQEAADKGVFVEAFRQDWGVIARVPLASGLLAGKYAPDHYFPPSDWRSMWSPKRVRESVERVQALRFLSREGRPRGPQGSMAQTAIAFVLSEPAVSTVISGAKTIAQIEETVAASEMAPLPEEDLREAKRIWVEREK